MAKNIKNYDDKFIKIVDNQNVMIENQQQIINKLMELNDKQMDMIKVLEDRINNTINTNIMTFAEATKKDIKETLTNNIIYIQLKIL